MGKVTLQPLKGFRDFLPKKMVVRRAVIEKLRGVFEKYGYEEMQTPALEYQEVLLGKYGQEAEKLMYLFKDKGEREVGLRYDLTVPLARVMSTHRDLPIPFKRFQIQPVWRAEKPQLGRYREVYQCDVDIVGSPSPMADAEILAITYDALTSLEFDSFKIRVNSRHVLFSAMKSGGVPNNKWQKTITSIDKLDKKSKEAVSIELVDLGLTKTQIEKVFKALTTSSPDKFLEETIKFAEKLGVGNNIVFDPNLARGLDYYTGPIFESVIESPKIGSITGGGRYDKLLADLGGPDLPATGTSFGLDRLVEAVGELGKGKDIGETTSKVLVTIFSSKLLDRSIEIANLLRKSAIKTEIYPDESAKLDKQLKYADKKGILWAVIIGPNEALKGEVVLKKLKNQKAGKDPGRSTTHKNSMTSYRRRAYIYLLIVAVIWGAAGPVVKFTLDGIDPFPFLSYRFSIAAIFSTIFFTVKGVKIPKPKQSMPIIILYGLLAVPIALGMLFVGLDKSTVLDMTLIGVLGPLIVTAGGAIFFRDRITHREKIGILIVLLGALINAFSPLFTDNVNARVTGNIFLLIFILADSGSVLIAKSALKHKINSVVLTNTAFILGALIIIPLTAFFYGPGNLIKAVTELPFKYHLGVWYMALASGSLAYFLYVRAVRSIEVSEATLFNYLQPAFAVPLAIFWLGEKLTSSFFIGALLITAGLVVAEYKKRRYNTKRSRRI